MKKKISLMASMVLYLIAIIILIYYFSLEFNELLHLSPTGRIVLLLLSCLIMYFGGLALTKYIDEKYKNKKSTEVLSGDEYFAEQCYKKEYLPTAWCRIYNRELVFNNCYFTPNIEFEDEEFSPRAIINAKRVQYIDISLYMYRRRNNSITTSVSNSKWYESYFIIINNLQKFAEEIKEKKSYKFLINRVEEITLSILKNTIEYGTSKEEISYITNEIKTKKLYSILLKSKNIKMRILGYLMKQPKIFIKLYKAKKGKTKNHNILYKSHEVKRYEV